ncbi:MAG: DUF962 domain-containing protein [Bacteriovoracia bacterium]
MRTFNQWMDEYGVSHQNPTNQMVHKICVPLIMFSVIGFLWSIPTPQIFENISFLNWATLFVVYCLGFYLYLNVIMFLGMLVQTLIMCYVAHQIYQTGNLLLISAVIFVLSWIGQFWGHKVEGKKPSFLQDIVFLLIGPLWVTRFFYKKIGINV